jgi:sugar lactone lactonase YvrE
MEEQPPDASRRNPRLDSAVDAVLARALAKAPDERYQNCRDFIDDARSALGVAPEDRSRLRARPLLAMVGLVLAAAVAVAGWAIVRSQNAAEDGARAKAAAKQILALRSAAPLQSGASVTRIDPATNDVVAAVAVPPDQTGLAVGAKTVWVATNHDYGLIQIDPTSDSTLPAPQVPGRAEGLAVAGDTVAVVMGPPRIAAVIVLSLGPYCRLGSIRVNDPCRIPLGQRRGQRATGWMIPRLTSDGSAIWVADPTRSTVGRIDPDRPLEIADTVRIQTLVHGRRMELTGLAAGAGGVWVTGGAWRTIVYRSGPRTYFEDRPVAAYLWRVDPSRRRVVARIRLPCPADSIAVGAGSVWVTTCAEHHVWQIDPLRNRIEAEIPLETAASGIAFGYGSIWLGDPFSGIVTRLDPKTHRVLGVIPVGPHPQQIAIGFGSVWVTHSDVH